MTFIEFLELLKSENKSTKYTKPVSKFTIHIDGGILTFVKVDAELFINREAEMNAFDYFTLLK